MRMCDVCVHSEVSVYMHGYRIGFTQKITHYFKVHYLQILMLLYLGEEHTIKSLFFFFFCNG